MRWENTKEEVFGFGVNYTVPFAHAYRTAKAFRVHVWETEISDSVENPIDNERPRLFDYMLMKMKERGIKMLFKPIAFWGNGWPEGDAKTPGFSC